MSTTADPRTGHLPGTPEYRRLNVAMVLVGLAAFGILYATQPILPQLGDDFGVGATAAALTVSAGTGALALLVIPATSIGVRIGRVRMIRWGLVAAVGFTLLAAAAPTYAVLVALRGLTGAALAGVIAVAMGHVAAEVHPSGLAGAMGLYVAGNTLGGVSGRLVTSGVADLLGWRGAVAVLGLVALVVTAVVWLLAEDTGPAPDARPDDGSPRGIRALLRDPAVLAVLLVPFVLMGGFVATYNYLSYRLAGPPFELSSAVIGLVFLAYLGGHRVLGARRPRRPALGTTAGAAARHGRHGRRPAADPRRPPVPGRRRSARPHRGLLRRPRGGQRLGAGARPGRVFAGLRALRRPSTTPAPASSVPWWVWPGSPGVGPPRSPPSVRS